MGLAVTNYIAKTARFTLAHNDREGNLEQVSEVEADDNGTNTITIKDKAGRTYKVTVEEIG